MDTLRRVLVARQAHVEAVILFGLAPLLVWLSADLSRYLSIPASNNTSAVWPPLGIALAARWMGGRAFAWIYPLVIGAWFAAHGYPAVICLLFALEQGAELWAMNALYRRFVDEADFLETLNGALRFYLFISVFALLPFAGLLVLAYTHLGYFPRRGAISVWMFQWLPEAIGVALFAPPAQRLLAWLHKPVVPRVATPGMGFVGLFVLILAVSLSEAAFGRYNFARGFDYLFFPLLIATALGGYTVTALVLLPVAVGCTLVGVYLSPWTNDARAWDALGEAVLFVSVLGVMTQLVVASTVERTTLIDSLRNARRHDPLTGELNRAGLIDHVQGTVWRGAWQHVAITLSLRNFRQTRELLPKPLADACEQWVARAMRLQLARWSDVVAMARLDPGLFGAIVAANDEATVRARIPGLLTAIRAQSFRDQGWDYRLEAGIGVLAFDAPDDVEDVLIASGFLATQAIQQPDRPLQFGARYQHLVQRHRDDLESLERFRKALQGNRFVLYGQLIQPLTELRSAPKMEFLLRMLGPADEPLAPAEFMAVASRFGYMGELDRWVVRQAFDEVVRHPELAARVGQFSINLSGVSLSDIDTLYYIREALEATALSAATFCFEVTETETIHDWGAAGEVIAGLKALGFALSLDDFGTGLASFDYLSRFPFDYVKIDGRFVRGLDGDGGDTDVIQAIVLVARWRGIATIAEFVENEAIARELAAIGVDYVQGFGVHRPAPVASVRSPN